MTEFFRCNLNKLVGVEQLYKEPWRIADPQLLQACSNLLELRSNQYNILFGAT